jgi:hypothetical protein
MSELKKDMKLGLLNLSGNQNMKYKDYISLLLHEPKKVKQFVEKWEDKWLEKVSDFEFEIEEVWEQTIQEAKEDLVDMLNFDEDEIEDWDDDDVIAQFGEGDIFAIWSAKLKDLKSKYPIIVDELNVSSEEFRDRFSRMGRHGPSTTMKKVEEMHQDYKQLKENVIKITGQAHSKIHNNRKNIFDNIFGDKEDIRLF